MRNLIIILTFFSLSFVKAQNFTTNRTPNGLEHNMLFNADKRFNITQTGATKFSLPTLFDGRFVPNYIGTPNDANPTVITIEGFETRHRQGGAWIGWSTRYWGPKRFRIEIFNTSNSDWVTIADYSAATYSKQEFVKRIEASVTVSKIRYTFYEGSGTDSRIGMSELFYIHPEGTTPYEGLFVNGNNTWKRNGNNLYMNDANIGIGTDSPTRKLEINGGALLKSDSHVAYAVERGNGAYATYGITSNTHDAYIASSGRIKFLTNNDKTGSDTSSKMVINPDGTVGIGTTNTFDYKLAVNGEIGAREIKVEVSSDWPDYVFLEDFKLPTLNEVEEYIKNKGHLKNIPSAKEVEENGVLLGEMNAKLLQKIEELTLYTIQQQKEIEEERKKNEALEKRLNEIEALIKKKKIE